MDGGVEGATGGVSLTWCLALLVIPVGFSKTVSLRNQGCNEAVTESWQGPQANPCKTVNTDRANSQMCVCRQPTCIACEVVLSEAHTRSFISHRQLSFALLHVVWLESMWRVLRLRGWACSGNKTTLAPCRYGLLSYASAVGALGFSRAPRRRGGFEPLTR